MSPRRRAARPTPRRKKVWADRIGVQTGLATSTLVAFDLLSTYKTAGGHVQGVTTLRTVIDMAWLFNEAHIMQDKLTIGLAKGTDTVADAPDPLNEPYADWAFNKTLYSGFMGTSGTGVDTPNVLSFDIHSMRKVDELSETWLLCFIFASGGLTADISFRARTLLLLP